MGKYTFTDRDNMVGKKPRQIYWTELQDAINDSADEIDNLTTDLAEHNAEKASQNKLGHVKIDEKLYLLMRIRKKCH